MGTEDDEPTEEEATDFTLKEEPYLGAEEQEENLFGEEKKEDFPIEENIGTTSGQMYVVKQRDLTNAKTPEANGVYMVLAYDPAQFKGNKQRIKDAAYQKVIEVRPELEDLVSPDDFGSIEESTTGGVVRMRALGTPFFKFFHDKGEFGSTTPALAPANVPVVEEEGGLFSEISYKEKDVGGTPMAIGRIVTDEAITPENILQEAISFINKKHPGIKIDSQSLDLTNLSKGEVEFIVAVPLAEGDKEKTLDEEFAEMEAENPETVEELEPTMEELAAMPGAEEGPGVRSLGEEEPVTLEKPLVAGTDFEIREAQIDTKKN
jgi:hypothetical protein